MRPISFSLIAVLSLACETATLDSSFTDNQLVDPELFPLQLEEQEDHAAGIPGLVVPGFELEAQQDEPKVPEWENEPVEPDLDEPEEEVEESEDEVQTPEIPVGNEEGAVEEAEEMACGVNILKPKALQLYAGEKLMIEWMSPDDGQRSSYIGLVTDTGEEMKLLAIDAKQGTETITLSEKLEPGVVRLFIGAEDSRQSWFCKDSSYLEILP